MEQLIELLVLLGGTLLLAIVFGTYLARLISYENRPIEKTLAIVESRFYRLIGIDVSKQMTWKQYLFCFISDRCGSRGYCYFNTNISKLSTFNINIHIFQ